MALSNRERVGRVMETLKQGMGPFILREYRVIYKGRYVDEMESVLASRSYPGLPRQAWEDQ